MAAREIQAQLREYFAALPPDARREVKKLRAVIRETTPAASEAFGYGIPGFKLDGRVFLWYAGWKNHVSLYPMSEAIRRQQAAALEGCGFSKGTIRFPLASPPSAALVKRLAKARLAEMKSAARKKA